MDSQSQWPIGFLDHASRHASNMLEVLQTQQHQQQQMHASNSHNLALDDLPPGSPPQYEPTSRLQLAIPFIPAGILVLHVLFILTWRYILPRFIKKPLDILTHDSVTIDDIPDAEPIFHKPILWKNIAITFFAIARLAVEIALLVSICRSGWASYKYILAVYGTQVTIWACIAMHSLLRHKATPYYGLTLFYLLDIAALIYGIVIVPWYTTLFLLIQLARVIPSMALLGIALSLPVMPYLPSHKTALRASGTNNTLDGPEDGVNLFDWLTVRWMIPLLSKAQKGTLEDEDIWLLSPFYKHRNLYPVFRNLVSPCFSSTPTTGDGEREVKRPSLMRKIYAFTAFDLFISSCISLVVAIITFAGPYFLKIILETLSTKDLPSPEARSRGYKIALLVFVLFCVRAHLETLREYHCRRAYERTRGALIIMIFEKATKRKDTSGSLGHRAKDEDEQDVEGSDAGRVLNMMNGDAYAVAQFFWEISKIVKTPIELVVAVFFLYQILGWSSLVGLSTIFVSYIALHLLMKRSLALTRALLSATDRRISVVSELVGAIRFLKYYAWEKIWVDKAIEAREKELAVRYKSNFNQAFFTLVFMLTPSAITITTFWCYTKLAHQDLNIPVAFSALSAFQLIQQPLFELPIKVMFFLRTIVSVKRLDRYLAEPEMEDLLSAPGTPGKNGDSVANIEANGNGHSSQSHKHAQTLAFHNSIHRYPQHEIQDDSVEPFLLKCSDLVFPTGKLTVVYGGNASGKTSLLMACIGEMDLIEGSMDRPTTRNAFAIATQDAWLEQNTIKENILFGAPYDEERFEQVIEACALGLDLTRWEARENTEIGERGISLSGGQRARVALARAIYSKAPYVLLDDPLSAVDASTARHLVEHCLGGPLMHSRTCILVTHHINLALPVASMLVKMNGGTAVQEEVEDVDFDDISKEKDGGEKAEFATVSKNGSLGPTPGTFTPVNGGLITKENRESGSVKSIVYKLYMKAAGYETWLGIISMLIAARGMGIFQSYFIKAWGTSYYAKSWKFLPPASENVNPWLFTYVAITAVTACVYLARLAFSYHGSFKAARALLYACLIRVTNAPSRWLDENPTGRLLNRFTADIGSIDSTITNSVTSVLMDLIGLVMSLTVVVYIVPAFAVFAVVCMGLYATFAMPYVRCSRDLRRLENNHRSPLFSRFGGLLQGLKVVRASGQEQRYMDLLMRDLDIFQAMDHFFWTARFYLSLRLDLSGALAIYVITIIVLAGGVSQDWGAFAIVQTQAFVYALHAACWSYAQLELDVNSVERIFDLLSIPQEPPAIVEKHRPPAHWPAYGDISIENLAVRYAPHLPFALKSVSVRIKAGQKVGIVGRTGSGKTTLALSLLRVTEAAAGTITIDGLDISKMGLRDLRERVTIISQESTLFEGTIRSNLDPTGQHSDHELWDVLRRVGMSKMDDEETDIARYVTSLDATLSIARALLRRTNVFIADEATASVDFETDEMVQHTLRRELHDATVITIAHRLRTIIDVDSVIVLSEGVVQEQGSPAELLGDPASAFSELCRQSNEFEELKYLAKLA